MKSDGGFEGRLEDWSLETLKNKKELYAAAQKVNFLVVNMRDAVKHIQNVSRLPYLEDGPHNLLITLLATAKLNYIDRIEEYVAKIEYASLKNRMEKAKTKDEFDTLAEEFNELGSHQDSKKLVAECLEKGKAIEYASLKNGMEKAKTRDEFDRLVNGFNELGNYKESKKLAAECLEKGKAIENRNRFITLAIIGLIILGIIFGVNKCSENREL